MLAVPNWGSVSRQLLLSEVRIRGQRLQACHWLHHEQWPPRPWGATIPIARASSSLIPSNFISWSDIAEAISSYEP